MTRISGFCCFLLVSVHVQAADDAKKELDKLAGLWRATSLEIGGREVIQANSPEIKVTIENDRIKFPGGDQGQFKLRLDPSTNPKIMDLVNVGNKDEYEGIFDLDGDKLRICIRTPAGVKDRPSEFVSQADTGLVLLKLERIKE